MPTWERRDRGLLQGLVPNVAKPQWKVYVEADFGLDGDSPDYAALAEAFLDHRGLQICGPAGVGKTYTLDRLLEAVRLELLKRQTHNPKLLVGAMRHCAARIAGGRTLEHIWLKYSASPKAMPKPGTVLVIDEMSEVRVDMWWRIASWVEMGVLVMMLGDFRGQRLPIFDRWQVALDACDVESCRLIHKICGGARLEMSTYRRGDDPEFFERYCALYPDMDKPNRLAEHVEHWRQMYALHTPSPDFFLAMSHKKRVYVNAAVNARIAASVATKLLIEAPEEVRRVAMKPQDMYIWPGMLLIGNPPRSTKGGIANGVLYTVEKMNAEFVWVRCRPEYQAEVRSWDAPAAEAVEEADVDMLDEEHAPEPEVVLEDAGDDGEEGQTPSREEKCDGDLIRLTHATVAEKLRLTHCLLYSNIQGMTIKNRHVALMDCDHPHFTLRDLNTGVSRATHGSFVHVLRPHEELICRTGRMPKPVVSYSHAEILDMDDPFAGMTDF